MPGVYKLKHPGSCTGMYWRADPRPGAVKNQQVGGGDWPRNGSILVGVEHQVGAEKYLEVSAWKQNGADKLTEGCLGLWMPFEQGRRHFEIFVRMH